MAKFGCDPRKHLFSERQGAPESDLYEADTDGRPLGAPRGPSSQGLSLDQTVSVTLMNRSVADREEGFSSHRDLWGVISKAVLWVSEVTNPNLAAGESLL